VTVKRSIDERQFPSRAKLAEILDPYAWKLMGNSVQQAGDPTPRVVVHIQQRLPYAFLLMAPSGYGKSSISKLLGSAQGLKTVSGDALIHQVSLGKHDVSEKLRALIQKDYCHTNIAPIIETIFDSKLGDEWVNLWLSQANGQDLMIDAFVPRAHWDYVSDHVREMGFAPIHLVWELIGPKLHDRSNYTRRTENYVRTLRDNTTAVELEQTPITNRLVNALFKNPRTASKSTYDPASLPADFDPDQYLRLHPDVAKAGMDPAYHYARHGMKEGRRYK